MVCKEFVSRLPSSSGTFTQAQVAVMQFSSSNRVDHPLSDDRNSLLNTLDCDRCSPSGSGVCSYYQTSGGTSTMQAIIGAIELFQRAPSRADAKKVIILATDGTPNGLEALPPAMQNWCGMQGYSLQSREDIVVCASKYAQATPGVAPNIPAKTCGLYDSWECVPYDALTPLDATIVTVGVNAKDYMDAHFEDVASDSSLYLKVDNIKGDDMDSIINDLLSKACPSVDCVCKPDTPWGQCDMSTGLQTRKCIPIVLPDKGGKPCESETRPCGDCAWHWGPYGACNKETGKKTRSVIIDKQPVPPDGAACPTDDQEDECQIDCEYSWGPWSSCANMPAGTMKTRSPVITQQALNGGRACPQQEESDCGIVDCEYTWTDWSSCDSSNRYQISNQKYNPGRGSRRYSVPARRDRKL